MLNRAVMGKLEATHSNERACCPHAGAKQVPTALHQQAEGVFKDTNEPNFENENMSAAWVFNDAKEL